MASKRSPAQIAAAKRNLEKARAARSRKSKGTSKSKSKGKSYPPKGSDEWYESEVAWAASTPNILGGAAWWKAEKAKLAKEKKALTSRSKKTRKRRKRSK